LEGAGTLQTDDISDWGNLMIELNKKFGSKNSKAGVAEQAMNI